MPRGDIKNMGDRRQLGATETNRGGFTPGKSGNPGGKISLKKTHEWACAHDPEFAAACGVTIEEARGRLYALQMKTALAGPRKIPDPNWTFSMNDMMQRHFGKPQENVKMIGDVTPEAHALLEALRLTPHERRQLADAQDSTAREDAAEDDAAMAELVDGLVDGDLE